MPSVDIVIESSISRSVRCRQLEAMFDVPPSQKQKLEWKGDLPYDDQEWNIGLIVGPSGSGKSVIGKDLFGEKLTKPLEFKKKAVIDDFDSDLSIETISEVCSAVGFNTIPAWLRPYGVLSGGEKFRVEIARKLLEGGDFIVVDEFTSVVDRQIAKIGAHAVQRYVRKNKKKFVALSCHYDIIEWLNPDWIFEPATMTFRPRGCLRRRPNLNVSIGRVPYGAWRIFAPFHYLTAELHKGAQCFGLFVDDTITTFAGVLHLPNRRARDLKRISRIVTLPDWQGLGLAPVLAEKLGAAYKAIGFRLRIYPAHPPLIRAADRAPEWSLKRKPMIQQKTKPGISADHNPNRISRHCAIFEYCGPAMSKRRAQKLIQG